MILVNIMACIAIFLSGTLWEVSYTRNRRQAILYLLIAIICGLTFILDYAGVK